MRNTHGTALSLEECATVLGLNKWLMAQFLYRDLSATTKMAARPRITKDCDDVWYERIHHNGKPSRYEFYRAIQDAEKAFVRVFGYFPAPTYHTVKLPYPKHWNPQLVTGGGTWNLRGEPKCLTLPFKKLIELGTPTETTVATDHELELYSETLGPANDGVPDYLVSKNEITIPDTVANWQIVARYPIASAISADNVLSPYKNQTEWEIRPLQILTISTDAVAGTRNIKIAFPARCGVRWQFIDIDFPEPLIAADTSVYLSSVDVFYTIPDTCLQGRFLWKGDDCAVTESVACFKVLNEEDAIVCPINSDPCGASPTIFANACSANGRSPDQVEVTYLSGVPRLDTGGMNSYEAQIVTWLATARLQCQPCGCGCNCTDCHDGTGHPKPLHWFSEVATVVGPHATFLKHSREKQNNPFGPTNGDVKAWEIATDESLKDMGVTL